jgi:hypothetical protein
MSERPLGTFGDALLAQPFDRRGFHAPFVPVFGNGAGEVLIEAG